MSEGSEEAVSTAVLTIPNLISFARLLLLPVFLWVYLTGHYLAGVVILGVVGVSDFLDGFVARATGQVSVLGKLLDPLADRLVIIAVLIAFGAKDTVPWLLVGVIVARDLIVMIAFAALERKGLPRLPVNKTGKRATASLFTGFAIAALSVLFKVSHVAGLRSDASGVRDVALAFLILGALLYWVAGGLYAAEMRRQLAARPPTR
ncbi:MAG TPA: CDP-alcohol phosphatidyltransferase family protein [Actinomycetota bacterium]|nr:CDP-alcohol phosphatidyltransferase family protein [Actinomycetota bacterium]